MNDYVSDRSYEPPTDPFLTVLHCDADVIIVSKQSGILSVPGRGPDKADSVATRAQSLFPDALIVHRLDMETSGLMVLARNPTAHRNLSKQFELRHVSKHYIAQVLGKVAANEGEVDAPLICDWPNRPRQMIDWDRGKTALTRWQVLSRDQGTTRLALFPVTGRSHQLRVHMMSLGHPILGDSLYADADALSASNRLMLHAEALSFQHPATGCELTFTDPAPW